MSTPPTPPATPNPGARLLKIGGILLAVGVLSMIVDVATTGSSIGLLYSFLLFSFGAASLALFGSSVRAKVLQSQEAGRGPVFQQVQIVFIFLFFTLFSIGAVWVGYGGTELFWRAHPSDEAAGWETRFVVVANNRLKAGAWVSYARLSQRSIPAALVGPDLIAPEQASRVIGARILAPLEAGEPLRFSLVSLTASRDLCPAANGGP
jgi:hypothetical protein